MNRLAVLGFAAVVIFGPQLGGLQVHADATPVDVPLANPGFEGAYRAGGVDPNSKSVISGVLPTGWQDDSKWADVTVDYSQDTATMHGGAAALKVNYSAHRAGACQFYQYVNQIQAGHSYTMSLWVKGDGKVPVTVLLRQRTAPYTRYGEVSAVTGDTWVNLSATATATETGSALFMIMPSAPTVFEVDDAELVDNGG